MTETLTGLELDAAVARALGLTVVDEAWPCRHNPAERYELEAEHFIQWPGKEVSEDDDREVELHPVYLPLGAGWPPRRVNRAGIDPDLRIAEVEVIPNYSTNIADAWPLVDWLRERWGRWFFLDCTNRWCCYSSRDNNIYAFGDTAEEAICRAVLVVAEREGT